MARHPTWVVRPRALTVTVRHAGTRPIVLRELDTLEDPIALPGLRYPLSELFENLARR